MFEFMKRGVIGVVCAAVLAACGGGGGDSGGGDSGGGTPQSGAPNAATADINSADFSASSDGAARSALSSFNSLSLITGSGSAVGAGTSRAEAFQSTAQRLAAARLLANSAVRDGERAYALAVHTETEACDSGNLLFTIDEASATGNTVGDNITVSSQGCVVSGQPVSGSLRLTLTAFAESQTASSGSVTLAFNAFGVPALTLSGSVAGQFTEGSDGGAGRLSFQGLTATTSGNTVQWFHTVDYGYSASSGAETVSFSGLVGVNGGLVRFDQIAPFTLVGGVPNGGVLQITGANGGRVRIVAGSTRFSYAYFATGNNGSTPDATAQGLTY